MLRTLIARRAHELDALAPVWRGLEAGATMFQSFLWNRLAAQFFAGREAPCVVLAETTSGVALIPAARHAFGLTLLGESLFDYRDLLCAGDSDALRQAWEAVAGLGGNLSFCGLRADALGHWSGADTSAFCAAPQVCRRDVDVDSFIAAHTRSGRLLRRLTRMGAEVRCHAGTSSGLVRWIYQRKAEQMAGAANNLFADPVRVDFMVEVCRQSGAACEIFTLETPGTIAAALLTFVDGRVRRFYTIYHDAAWAKHSPGVALVFEATRRSLAEGLDCDYLTGEQPHKTRFATSALPLLRVSASPARLSCAFEDTAPLAA